MIPCSDSRFASGAGIASGCAWNPDASTQEPVTNRALIERHAFPDDVAGLTSIEGWEISARITHTRTRSHP